MEAAGKGGSECRRSEYWRIHPFCVELGPTARAANVACGPDRPFPFSVSSSPRLFLLHSGVLLGPLMSDVVQIVLVLSLFLLRRGFCCFARVSSLLRRNQHGPAD